MLDQVPWLLDELDARIQKLDRVPRGAIGRAPRSSGFETIDFDAAETARDVRKQLQRWVEKVARRDIGCAPRPTLEGVETKVFARWLQLNVEAIARLDCAGDVYHGVNQLVGSGDKGGRLVGAINRRERHFAGPCPTIRGYDTTGDPIECGQDLYGESGERTVVCPECGQEVDIEKNRRKVAADRDLMTADTVLETLTNIGEPVEPQHLERWIRARRLRPYGWLHLGVIVKTRVRKDDIAVYSFERARKLRRRDQQLTGLSAADVIASGGESLS